MRNALPTILIGFLLILLVDSLGSIASRQMNFNYGHLSILTFTIYSVISFVITKRVNKKTAIISAALLGLFDATIGWKISIILQANTGSSKMIINPSLVIITIIFVIIISTLFGLLGSWIALKISNNKINK